jgi:hypothetical protein
VSAHLPRIGGKKGLEASWRQGGDRDELITGIRGDDEGLPVRCSGEIAAPLQQVVQFVFGIEECRRIAESDQGNEADDHRARQHHGPI